MGPSSSANYANVLIEQNTSPLVILHARENDTYWLKENIEKLTDIARQNNSTVGSVYDSLEEMAPTIPTQYDPIEYPFRGIDKVEIK